MEKVGYSNNVTIYLNGESSHLELINFNEVFKNINYIDCMQIITITLDEIKETKCEKKKIILVLII